MTSPPRIVLDTNVIVSALLTPGAPRRVVEMCRRGDCSVFLSDSILAEVAGVLRRKLGWTGPQVLLALEELRAFSNVVVPATAVDIVKEDPSDNRVLECALECGAVCIVTGDTRHLQPLESFQGVPVVSPRRFLELMQRS